MEQTKRAEFYDGFCSVCGETTKFKDMSSSIRETYQCANCRASMRERITASAIIEVFGQHRVTSLANLAKCRHFEELHIFEPGVSGAYRPYLNALKHYTNSFYWTDIPFGATRDGVRNEDLMNLSFESGSLDLVISSDIFEHVRKPWDGFREVRRVLTPGGYHIFSVPSFTKMRNETVYRVDTTTDEDVHVLPPVYHGDGKGGKSLVYTDFGEDMYDELLKCGFEARSFSLDDDDPERRRVNAFISKAI